MVNYAERHRADLRVGTAITEGTANFLINRRMNKSQQMRWTRLGTDRLLQDRSDAPSTTGPSAPDLGRDLIQLRRAHRPFWRPEPPHPAIPFRRKTTDQYTRIPKFWTVPPDMVTC